MQSSQESAGAGGAVVVRAATERDRAARAALVRQGLAEHDFDAFIYFFFQELTLQACVLCGAVLFIFCGASLCACALLAPAAAALVALAVRAHRAALAASLARRLRDEAAGWVAEYTGPPAAPAPSRLAFVFDRALDCDRSTRKRVIGTVSVSEFWGPDDVEWLHLLAVDSRWRRRGVARALLAAARLHAARAGRRALHAAATSLQPAARGALLAAGYRVRDSYHRPLLGAALSLPVARLALDLTRA